MTTANKWIEEGWKKGFEQGFVTGMKIVEAKALSDIAIQLLYERFNHVPKDIKEGILNTDTVSLKLLLSNSFRYESIDDVRKYIQ